MLAILLGVNDPSRHNRLSQSGEFYWPSAATSNCSLMDHAKPQSPPEASPGSARAVAHRPQVGLRALVFLASLLALAFISTAILGSGGWSHFAADSARPAVAAMLLLFAAATPMCGCHIAPAIEED